MVLLRRLFAALALWGMFVSVASSSDLKLLPITGDLSGRFALPSLSAMPPLDWKISLQHAAAGRRSAEISITSQGAQLRAHADLDALTGDGTWEIAEAKIDPGVWFSVVAPEVMSGLAGISATGEVTLTGNGTLRDGRPSGVIKFVWADGVLRQADQGWSLEHIAMSGECRLDATGPTLKSTGPFELTIGTITTKRLGARKVFIQALLNVDQTLTVQVGRIEVAGGEITIDPCTITLSPLVVDFNLRITRIGLQDVVALVPESLSDARGRVDGQVRVMWSVASGLQIGAGNLSLRDDEVAMIRLTAAPGFLTTQAPKRFTVLPAWTGPLRRWIAPKNPAYEDIRKIEMGQTDLRVRALSVQLTPQGDEFGRTAHVNVIAGPVQERGTVKEVVFDVNVSGPLSAVLRVGMNQSISVSTH